MKLFPKIGTTGEFQFTVEQKHAIDFAIDGMPRGLHKRAIIRIQSFAAQIQERYGTG